MPIFVDQIGQSIDLKTFPKRIISLVPSQTELLIDLGLAEKLIGCTKFCIHPKPMPAHVQIIGGTKNPKIQTIIKLKPDLIIANKEENNFTDIEQLKAHCPVWVSDINTVDDALKMIESIGKITNTTGPANSLTQKINFGFSDLREKCSKYTTLEVSYFIWKNPYMVVGENNFINSVLELINLNNVWGNSKSRYPEVSQTELKSASQKFNLLSTEPFPFKNEDCIEMDLQFPQTKAIIVDGELFSWYGSRMLKMSQYLLNLRAKLATFK